MRIKRLKDKLLFILKMFPSKYLINIIKNNKNVINKETSSLIKNSLLTEIVELKNIFKLDIQYRTKKKHIIINIINLDLQIIINNIDIKDIVNILKQKKN